MKIIEKKVSTLQTIISKLLKVNTNHEKNMKIKNYKILKTIAVSIFMGCSVLATQAQIYVDASATGAKVGTSWIDAFTDLQTALDAAAENAEIRVASGTYKPTAAPDDSADNRNKAFHFNRNLILKGSYNPEIETQDFTNPSILSGDFNGDDVITGSGSTLSITNNTENAYHVLITAGLTTAAQIEGFYVTGGFANGSGSISYSNKSFNNNRAGGMYNYNSSPSIVNVTFSGNSTTSSGGGMYNDSSSPDIVNTVLSGNRGNQGGGMYNSLSSPDIINTVFSGNKADSGGGMYNIFSSSPSIVNTVFSGNKADYGGGMYNDFSSLPSIVNTVFSGNSATIGGGIRNISDSSPTIYNSVFYSNGSDIANNASSVTGEHNFSEHFSHSGFTDLEADPFLDSVSPIGADGEWFTDDDGLQPSPDSPLINAGDATKLPLDTSDLDKDQDIKEAIPFDITGRTRVLNASVDVGAYEFSSSIMNEQTQIYVDISAMGANNGTSWRDAFTDLQHALDAAAENAEIRVAAGTYKPTAAPDETTDDNRNKAFHFDRNLILKGSYNPEIETQDFTNPSILSGDLNGDDTVSDDGSISGNSENAYHVLITADLTTAAQIEGFLITGGFANGASNISYSGKTFFDYSGAGMYNNASSPSIVNTVFSGNSGTNGGGMYNDTSSPSIVNSTFSGNSAADGGGMHNQDSSPSMVNTVFSGNVVTITGGGMYNQGSFPSMVNMVFSGNSGTNGGGMYNATSSPSIVNSTFSGNSADFGGGIYNFSSFPSFVNSTFSGNKADSGGGIRNYSSSSTIYNSVFYGNGSDIENRNNSSVTASNNFSEHFSHSGFTDLEADPFYRSSDPIGTDGVWFTEDDGLKPTIGSPIIDAGDIDKLPLDTADLDGDGDTTKAIPFDITGRSRVLGVSLDVGAYEYDSAVLSVKDRDFSGLDIYSSGYKTLVIHGVFNAKTTASVYSLQGKLVASKTFDKFSTSNSLDVSMLSTGIYIVKMYNAKHQVHTKKLFIQ